MSTMPTTTPVPSNSPLDLLFNAEKIDETVNGTALVYIDRFGVPRMTLAGAIAGIATINNRGAWAAGQAYVVKDIVQYSGTWYMCVAAHSSSSAFETDQAACWRVYQGVTTADLGAIGAGKGAKLVAIIGADGVTPSNVDDAVALIRTDVASLKTRMSASERRLADTDALQEFAADLANNVSRSLDSHGDSTEVGADPANLANAVAIPPWLQLQNFVRNFFGNTALTVNNKAISGTTIIQMLAGQNADGSPDGSGMNFAQKMVATSARVVTVGIGANDAWNQISGAPNTTPAAFRQAVNDAIDQAHAAGKTILFKTPNPALTILTFGSVGRAEYTARYAQIIREVCSKRGVRVTDKHATISKVLASGQFRPEAIMPDGLHFSQAFYIVAGNNDADPILGGQVESFTRANQWVGAARPSVRATSQTVSQSQTSRCGAVVTTGTTGVQTMRMLFRVEDTGLDIALEHPIWSNGSSSISLNLDGSAIGVALPFSQFATNFSSSFFQDVPVVIARNVMPGFHMLTMTTANNTGAIGAHGLKSLPAEKPLLLASANGTPISQRKLMSPKLEHTSPTANTMFVCDDLPISRLDGPLGFEVVAQMLKTGTLGSALIMGANVGANGGSAACERMIAIGLNTSGFLFVHETTTAGTYTSPTVLGSTDLSLAPHTYRVQISAANPGSVTVFVDDVQVGSAVALTQNYYGGYLGLFKSEAGGRLTVSNISRVWLQ